MDFLRQFFNSEELQFAKIVIGVAIGVAIFGVAL